jgi:mono/diheme cytochrome c family protein
MKAKIVLSTCIACLLYCCSPTLFIPSSNDPATQQRLLTGRKLYVSSCSGCHNLHLPQEFDALIWKENLDEMQVNASITNEEKQLIYEYLTSQLRKVQ